MPESNKSVFGDGWLDQQVLTELKKVIVSTLGQPAVAPIEKIVHAYLLLHAGEQADRSIQPSDREGTLRRFQQAADSLASCLSEIQNDNVLQELFRDCVDVVASDCNQIERLCKMLPVIAQELKMHFPEEGGRGARKNYADRYLLNELKAFIDSLDERKIKISASTTSRFVRIVSAIFDLTPDTERTDEAVKKLVKTWQNEMKVKG